jgi:deoxyribonuclease-4
MLPESDFDLGGLMRALAELKCGGRIVCESPVMDQDALLIQKAWQRAQRQLS